MRPASISDLPAPPAGKSGWPWTEAAPAMPETMPDGKPWPKISIVTPNYNYGRYLEATIRSVLLQGYPNLEYIVIDGGSSDDSPDIIRRYAPWIDYWESDKDRGQSHAINKGFSHASGEVVAWLNSDDQYAMQALMNVAFYVGNYPDVGAFCGGAEGIDEKGQVVCERYPPALGYTDILNWWEYLPQPSCFMRMETWRTCGPLDETLHFQMDYDLWLAIAKHSTLMPVPETLSRYLIHEEAKTAAHQYNARSTVEQWLVLQKHSSERAKAKMLEYVEYTQSWQRRIDRVAHMPIYRAVKWLYYKLANKARPV